jgi:hypothetical protein
VSGADPAILHGRLAQVLALEADKPFNEAAAREAIVGFCEGAVCARIPSVGGKVATFERYFEAVYGRTLDGKPVKPKATRAAHAR